LLAGRKLLLADDSITIQKVVDLTFADEGVTVLCVSNGREAIERLLDFAPDVVLADVFMPQMNGYEVCEYIKQNDTLKHIPVLLLVGSFEPFDEEEARRVGANDTLTKPFQSIRRLIEKVGLLASSRPSEEQIPTAELPKPELAHEPPIEKLSPAELEITTADTQPLPPELRHVVEEAVETQAKREQTQLVSGAQENDETMESSVMDLGASQKEQSDDVLLDLGDFKQSRSVLDDNFVLDIDLDEMPEPSPADGAFQASAFQRRDNFISPTTTTLPSYVGAGQATLTEEAPAANTDQMATTQEFQRIVDEPIEESSPEPTMRAPEVVAPPDQAYSDNVALEQYSPPAPASSPEFSVQQLSPEMIDAIARRAVEHMSEKVVQEIAWEVVPQLAELLIKRQLEEKNS
jgi:CheY-like chemotaxis protein